MAGGALLVLDANVLIDYCAADRSVLTLAARHVGPIHVPSVLLDEVDDLDENECERLGLVVACQFCYLATAQRDDAFFR